MILPQQLQDENPELITEYRKVRQQYKSAAALALFLLCAGSVFYHIVEHFGWVDAFYFCTITLTTIGYGDLVPATTAGKIFTIFYAIVGIGVIGIFGNIAIKSAVLRREVRRTTKR
jgi:voltage-gated potassium channel